MNRFGIVVGIESASSVDVDENSPIENVEAHLTEVEVADKEVATALETGHDLMDDEAMLEALEGIATESAATGGIDNQTVVLIGHSVGNLAARWGVETQEIGTESESSPLELAQIAQESIKSVLADIWERFLQWFRDLRVLVKKTWLKLSNAGKSMQKQADKLDLILDEGLGGLKDGKDKVSGSWVNSGSFDGAFDIEKTRGVAAAITKDSSRFAAMLADIVKEAHTVIKDDDKTYTIGAGATAEKFAKDFGSKTKEKLKRVLPTDHTDASIRALPNNSYLANFSTVRGEEMRFVATGAKAKDDEVAVATASMLSDLASDLRVVGKGLEDILKDFAKLDAEESKLEKVIKDKQKQVKGKSGEERTAVLSAKAESQRRLRAQLALRSSYEHTLRHAGKAIYGYATASIKCYEKLA